MSEILGAGGKIILDAAKKKVVEEASAEIASGGKGLINQGRVKLPVMTGSVFTHYIETATKKYDQIKTIATGGKSRRILGGKNPLYVPILVSDDDGKYHTGTITQLLEESKCTNILLEGTGGAGKSMLMRYLFLKTADEFQKGGKYVPILLELRKISTLSPTEISQQAIFNLIYASITQFDKHLTIEQFEYSLNSGKHLLLLDGFDEISDSLAREAAVSIQDFCAKYPNNPCVITSRPDLDTAPLQTFSTLKTEPLIKGQALNLIRKIESKDERAKEFYDQLDDTLFDQHKDFAENPLLLSMMYLTFMRNLSIPDHLSAFYQNTYNALYSEHDSMNKGAYHREFKCKDLEEKQFQQLFSYFCFQSYFKNQYEFSEEQLLAFLDGGIEKLGLKGISARDYLADLQNIVCMIIRDGNVFRFSHRSFQAYFAAKYSNDMTDEAQEKMLDYLMCNEGCDARLDYYRLLFQLSPDRFAANALEKGLRALNCEAELSPSPDLFYAKCMYQKICVFKDERGYTSYRILKYANRLRLFMVFFAQETDSRSTFDNFSLIIKLIAKAGGINEHYIYFEEIQSTARLTDNEREKLLQALLENTNAVQSRAAIRQWLTEQDEKRAVREASSDLASLLDAL